MPEYLAPGVYVEETSFRAKSIEGVGTSTTAFVGPTRKGPVASTRRGADGNPPAPPELITSFGDFVRTYGGLQDLPLGGTPTHQLCGSCRAELLQRRRQPALCRARRQRRHRRGRRRLWETSRRRTMRNGSSSGRASRATRATAASRSARSTPRPRAPCWTPRRRTRCCAPGRRPRIRRACSGKWARSGATRPTSS